MSISTGEEWWFLKVHVVHLETLYTRLKSFFKADLSTNTKHLHDGITLIYLSCIFCNPSKIKSPICTRKRNPEDSGRSSKMVSSCQWPFSSFLLASSLLKSSFYFKHSGTLQSSAVVSLIRHNKQWQKTEPVRTATKNRVWPLQKFKKNFDIDWQLSFVGSSYFANVTN